MVIFEAFYFTEHFFLRVLNFADRGHSAKSAKIWTKIAVLWGRNQYKVKWMKFIADELPSDIFHNKNLDEIVPISTLHTQFSEPKSLLIKMQIPTKFLLKSGLLNINLLVKIPLPLERC